MNRTLKIPDTKADSVADAMRCDGRGAVALGQQVPEAFSRPSRAVQQRASPVVPDRVSDDRTGHPGGCG
jgi:hypothetical protein